MNLLRFLSFLGSAGVSSVNAVNIATIKRHVNELKNELPVIQQQLAEQRRQLTLTGKTVKDTVLVLNSHSQEMAHIFREVDTLKTVIEVDFAHVHLITTLLTDMLREIGSSIDTLAIGQIPPY